MTVREVFELRKQGKIEEAYEAIRPMYALHKGRYTSLAMFWVASDVLKKRLREGRTADAVSIFKALWRLYPTLIDSDGKCRSSLLALLLRLSDEVPTFSLLDYLPYISVSDSDWCSQNTASGHVIPPVAPRLIEHAYDELRQNPTVDRALLMMPLLEKAMAHSPSKSIHLRCMALIYQIMGEHEKAESIMPSESDAEHLQLGRWGEELAASFLREKGYVILERNWRSGHRDIDIVAKTGSIVVFVEVKTRRDRLFADPETSVNYQKQSNLQKSINHYVKSHQLDCNIRFDIITVVGSEASTAVIDHLEDVLLI